MSTGSNIEKVKNAFKENGSKSFCIYNIRRTGGIYEKRLLPKTCYWSFYFSGSPHAKQLACSRTGLAGAAGDRGECTGNKVWTRRKKKQQKKRKRPGAGASCKEAQKWK